MRLYNAIYAIWLLSGNIMTDQTVSVSNPLDSSASRHVASPLLAHQRATFWVNHSFSQVSRLVATMDTDPPRVRSTNAVLVRPSREMVSVTLTTDVAHLAFSGNAASWHFDNISTWFSRPLADPHPGSSPQAHGRRVIFGTIMCFF